MIKLFLSVALLGLLAIDPAGIAAMPVLLAQKKPYLRSLMFLGGSFTALMAMGLVFSVGFGMRVLRYEQSLAWLIPGVEVLAGLSLLVIAAVLLWRFRKGRLSTEPSNSLISRLQLSKWHLFMLGAVLVSLQSVADMVFVIAMIRIGQLHESMIILTAAVASYALAALALQFVVVAAYWLTPVERRDRTIGKIHTLLARYANQALISIGILIGSALLLNGCLAIFGAAHL